MRIGFIGAGKVGFSLGRHFADSGLKISGYASNSSESARKAAEFTDSAAFSDSAELIRASDLLFVTVPDAAIGQAFESFVSLHESGNLDLAGKFFCHCSGSLSAHDAFGDVGRVGAQACSVHPLCAVNDRYTSHEDVAKALFTIEGDLGLVDIVRGLLESAGNTVVSIDSRYKARYHAACSIGLNLMVGLVQESIDQLIECGFSEEQALAALGPALLGNVSNIVKVGPLKSLTGPIERNDFGTVQKHLDVLSPDETREVYRLLSLRLVKLASEKNPERDYSAIKNLLDDERPS